MRKAEERLLEEPWTYWRYPLGAARRREPASTSPRHRRPTPRGRPVAPDQGAAAGGVGDRAAAELARDGLITAASGGRPER
jgi:hypothetical protein